MKQEKQEKEIIHIDVDSEEKFPTLKAGNNYSINGIVISISEVANRQTHKYYNGTCGKENFEGKDLHQLLRLVGIERKGCKGGRCYSSSEHKTSLLSSREKAEYAANAAYDVALGLIRKGLLMLSSSEDEDIAAENATKIAAKTITRDGFIKLRVEVWEAAVADREKDKEATKKRLKREKQAKLLLDALIKSGYSMDDATAIVEHRRGK